MTRFLSSFSALLTVNPEIHALDLLFRDIALLFGNNSLTELKCAADPTTGAVLFSLQVTHDSTMTPEQLADVTARIHQIDAGADVQYSTGSIVWPEPEETDDETEARLNKDDELDEGPPVYCPQCGAEIDPPTKEG